MRARAAADLGLLGETGWLAEQPEAFRNRIAAAGEWREYPKDAVIQQPGATDVGLFGLGMGAVDFAFAVDQEKNVRFHRYRPGLWWGALPLLTGRPSWNRVFAAEPARVFAVPNEAFADMLANDVGAWRSIAALGHQNHGLVIRLLGEALTLPPSMRLARRLLDYTANGDTTPATLDDLAELMGVTRSTIQRAIADLIREGAVHKGYRRVVIRDRAALERVANGG